MSLNSNLNTAFVEVATEAKKLRTLINGNAADLASLNTTTKTNIVVALNELLTRINQVSAAAGATINDAATSSTVQTYSVNKIRDLVNTSITALTDGAPQALDTLRELSAAIGDDASFASNVTNALGNRLRVDAVQTLNATQKAQALANIGGVSTGDIGDTTTDFAAIFRNGLL